jgi:hypothetical protein
LDFEWLETFVVVEEEEGRGEEEKGEEFVAVVV